MAKILKNRTNEVMKRLNLPTLNANRQAMVMQILDTFD
jgi:hypothetical protein